MHAKATALIPKSIQEPLQLLRDDYTRVNGSPFKHFYCPILCRDEETELCLGHIVNEAIPNSCRACVVQRKDVDGFFGTVFESEFVTSIKVHDSTLADVLLYPDQGKKLKPRLQVDGGDCKYHHDRGHGSASQSRVLLKNENGDPVRLVLHKDKRELATAQVLSITVEADFRLSSLVSIIKAGYLTLFRLLGYDYALSAAGLGVGQTILGRFYSENCGKSVSDAKSVRKK